MSFCFTSCCDGERAIDRSKNLWAITKEKYRCNGGKNYMYPANISGCSITVYSRNFPQVFGDHSSRNTYCYSCITHCQRTHLTQIYTLIIKLFHWLLSGYLNPILLFHWDCIFPIVNSFADKGKDNSKFINKYPTCHLW